ncbi:MAG: globin [Phycisphaerales bacterium]|nr:globin [Phycisphaerales bacterium]
MAQSLYDTLGHDGFTRLVRAFYAQVPGDDILGKLYPPHDLAAAETRLRDYLIYRFGGPQTYIEQRGHPRMRARHLPFAIDHLGAARWLQLMDRAIVETQIPPAAADELRKFFRPLAIFMINRED